MGDPLDSIAVVRHLRDRHGVQSTPPLVNQWARQGLIPFARAQGRKVYRCEDIDAAVAAGTIPPREATWLTSAEVVAYLSERHGIERFPSVVRGWLRRGLIPRSKPTGAGWRIRDIDVDRAVRAGDVPPPMGRRRRGEG
ncbi:MAG: hypothetical protein KC492_07065 [Myxococcales bacterium]|nr:hypothetical protein [Myxococcales bacterium]